MYYNSKIYVYKVNEGLYLQANTRSYPTQKITWKKVVYTKVEIEKEMRSSLLRILQPKDIGGTFVDENNNNMPDEDNLFSTRVYYTFKKEDEGKYLKFYALLENYGIEDQGVAFYIEPEPSAVVLVKKVKSNKTYMKAGSLIELSVEFNKPYNKVPQKTKENVKWMERVDGKDERLVIDGVPMVGDKISFTIPPDWEWKTIILMPHLNKWTPKISYILEPLIEYKWSLHKSNKEIKDAKISDVLDFHIHLSKECQDKEVVLKLFNKFKNEDIYTNIELVIKLTNNKGEIQLNLVNVLEKISNQKNEILQYWEKNIINKLDANGNQLNLYAEIHFSKGKIQLDQKLLKIFMDVHIYNILDNHYRYSCHGGWIDMSHLTPTQPQGKDRTHIGAINLWNQIKNESGELSKDKQGFKVTYGQDMGKILPVIEDIKIIIDKINEKLGNSEKTVKPTYIGIKGNYYVKKGLDIDTKKRICMSIFQEISLSFEKMQGFFPESMGGHSSFEPSDLVSNVLGLYTVLENNSKEEVLQELKIWGARNSIQLYCRYVGTFTKKEYKNYKFTPRYFDNIECPHSPKCISTFPSKFQKIKKIEMDNTNFKYWVSSVF